MYNNRKITKFIALLILWIILVLLFIFYNDLFLVWLILLIIMPVFILKKIDNIFDKNEKQK